MTMWFRSYEENTHTTAESVLITEILKGGNVSCFHAFGCCVCHNDGCFNAHSYGHLRIYVHDRIHAI